ncbi:MAG: hypothetical protein QOD99_3189 [Chthoniobacter sp.]|jgi:hypothetical protein|nr:hypothetical protein [Chthoniobacter sp.]
MKAPLIVLGALLSLSALGAETSGADWPPVTRDQRPWTRMWWLGSAVDKPNLTQNLEALRAAGFGGIEITPIYGVVGNEANDIEYLSPKWIEMLGHTTSEAARLDMGVDMATTTGWPFGGPNVSTEDADATVQFKDGKIFSKPSGFKVKRAAPGGEGNTVNPYSPQALSRYLERFDKAFAAAPALMLPRAQFNDSFEWPGNWGNEVPGEFKARRGYDLNDHAAELFGTGDPETVARVKSDYRETLSDLYLKWTDTWVKWSHQHGELARNQAHGAPGNLLDLYAVADIPETEEFGASVFQIPGLSRDPSDISDTVPDPLAYRFASSAAHLAGRRLASSESCTWLREHFKASLAQMKPEIDQLFLAGINHIFFHGTAYSPQSAEWPGWNFYAAVELNPRNSIWRDVSEFTRYIARCQSFLQQGRPDNDVLLYWPVYDLWHRPEGMQVQFTMHNMKWIRDSSFGKLATALSERGYTLDYVSDQLLQNVRADAKGLHSGEADYRVIVVPSCDHMPVETLRKLISLASDGATIILADLPKDVPGLGKLDERRAALKSLVSAMKFEGSASAQIREARVKSGRVLLASDVEAALLATKIPRESLTDSSLQFIRRKSANGADYFIANLGAKPVDTWCALSAPLRSAVIFDPLSGASGAAATRGDGREIHLQLEPGETRIVRTSQQETAGPAWVYLQAKGVPQEVRGEWKVDFIEGGPVLPKPFSAAKLDSWTTLGDDEAKRFAGTARYSIRFARPAENADDYLLDLGVVRESARVKINGRDAGAFWSIPFRGRVGQFLQPGENLLEIEVTNLSANRIRDLDQRGVKWKIFRNANVNGIHGKPFDASGWELTPSGLLGPVTLIPMSKAEVQAGPGS